MLSWYCFQIFFRPLVIIPLGSVIRGMMKHFIFHIHWISVLRFLCINLFSASFFYYIPIRWYCNIYQ